MTPTPSGPALAETEPLTLPSRVPVAQKGSSGRVATKALSAGLPVTWVALVDASWARTPEAPRAEIARIFDTCMVMVIVLLVSETKGS